MVSVTRRDVYFSGACGSDKNDSTMITSPPKEDATDITSERAYSWRDWSIARGRDCLYIWSDVCALELSNGSNGWFRFILDGKLATMYSHGSPETGTDTTENRCVVTNGMFFEIYFDLKKKLRLLQGWFFAV